MNYPLAVHVDEDSDEDEYQDEKADISFGPNINSTNNQNREVKHLSPYDPKKHHRTVYPGMNFEGKCVDPKCDVKGQMVWVPLGYGEMQYAEKLFQCTCPICKEKLQPENIVNIGYRFAKVKFVGRKENDKKNKVEFSDEEKNGNLVKFTGGSDGNTVGWVYLNIQVDKL